MRRLSDKQLAELAFAALANARRLYDDALLLREAGRAPSAFVLLGLAADELGKHMLVFAFPTRGNSNEQWRKFWRRMNSHEEKLGNALLAAWLLDPFDLGDPPDRSAFHKQRLAATYVDFRDAGLQEPDAAINQVALDSAFGSIGPHLAYCERILSRTDPAALATSMQRARESKAARSDGNDVNDRYSSLAFAMAVAYGANEDEAAHFASVMVDHFPR